MVKKWALRLTLTGTVITALLIIIILNPLLTYAHKTTQSGHTIFHQQKLDPAFHTYFDQAINLVAESEYYNPGFKLDICLNDGSKYPAIMKTLRGQAFAWGFYNKVVLMGNANYKENYVELNGYKWNLGQLLAHEMIHCYQFNKRGFWKSNPVANIPEWKWEGYPEYISRQSNDQKDLGNNISRLVETEKTENNGWIQFADGTGTVIPYYKYWLLVQYCMDIKKMSYAQIIQDTTSEKSLNDQMMKWFSECE
ncbi:MAG: hypothetical protein WCF67_21805 [Chitinophagaceae bacterium]